MVPYDIVTRLAWQLEEDAGGCWVWVGPRNPDGYGYIWYANRQHHTHRVAYEATRGAVPNGCELDHVCRNRACCNPDHMDPVTHRENVLRGTSFSAVNARKTRCKEGHLFDAKNNSWGRYCRRCMAKYQRDRRAKIKEGK